MSKFLRSFATLTNIHRTSPCARFAFSTRYFASKNDEVTKAKTAKPSEDTIFGKIARKEIQMDLLHEDEQCVAFHDINKQAPEHFLVIPKEPIPQLSACKASHEKLLGHLMIVATQIAKKQGLAEDGYRLVINNGRNACQSVYHLHIHVLGGRQLDWPPDLIMSDEEKLEWSNVIALNKDRFVEKKTNFDLETLHPEARKRLKMLGFVTIDSNGEDKELPDNEIDAILLKTRNNEDPDIIADKYMMQHGLYDLFKSITTKIVLERPPDPIGFMVKDLEKQIKDKE